METDQQKIQRLEHNIEVMRDSYLPARLEIASRLMAAYLTSDNQIPNANATQDALDGADALLAAYNASQDEL